MPPAYGRLAHKLLQQVQLEYDASKAGMGQKAAARRVRKGMPAIKAQDVRLALVSALPRPSLPGLGTTKKPR